MKLHKSHEFLVGSIACQDQLEELWAIDSAAYGAASITYHKFRDWWRAFPSGLQVLHWQQGIGGAMGLWPLSDRSAARLINAQIKESALTGRMMRPFRHTPARHWYVSGIVLRPELAGTSAIRVLLAGGLRRWLDTVVIAFPFQFLALASSKEGELVLTRFGFHCYQKAHAMPDNIALFVLDAENRDDLLSVLEARLGPLH
jgi:hypothetical protein